MRSSAARRSRESGSMMMLMTFLVPFLLLPLVGLAIDASVARLVQLRLQAAVDGAATGAGRLLGMVADNKVESIALEFLKSNFSNGNTAGTWGAQMLVVVPGTDIVYTPGIRKTISVTARAKVPLLFLRLLSFGDAVVGSVGVATRTDSRIMFVLDRSGSMGPPPTGTNVIVAAKANAITFLTNFTNTDEVGLVVFDSGAVVGYPTYAAGAYSSAIPTAAPYGGPDRNYSDGSVNDMPHQINNVAASGGTGMAEALSLAYIELQKAHMRDLNDPNNTDHTDTRLNTIVLLTDGVPTAISLYLNNPNKIDNLANADNIVSATVCKYKTITPVPPAPTAANMMRGVFVITGAPPFTNTGTVGMYLIPSMDTAHSSSWWMTNAGQTLPPPALPFTTCPNGLMASSNPEQTYFTGNVPSADAWGNAVASPMDIVTNTFTGYTNSQIIGGTTGSVVTNGKALDRTQQNGLRQNYNWGLVMWNSVDQAAVRIRADANKPNRIGDTDLPMSIGIEVIGYTGNGGVDVGLLKRVANDPGAVGFDGSKPNGAYYSAANTADLTAAFSSVASDILRLAR
jgi:Flp pilus assembly protein TadG